MMNDELNSLFVIFIQLVTTRNSHPTTAMSTDKHSPAPLRENGNEPRHPAIMPNGHHAK